MDYRCERKSPQTCISSKESVDRAAAESNLLLRKRRLFEEPITRVKTLPRSINLHSTFSRTEEKIFGHDEMGDEHGQCKSASIGFEPKPNSKGSNVSSTASSIICATRTKCDKALLQRHNSPRPAFFTFSDNHIQLSSDNVLSAELMLHLH